MAHWRKLGMGIWTSPSFLSLSRPPPNGQSLFLHLCLGPHTLPLPGISRVGEAAMSEELGWSLKGFRRAFREVSEAGMAEADWEHRVVVVWKALQNSPPDNEKVLIGWAKFWGLIPECELKMRYYMHMKSFLETYDHANECTYAKTFMDRYRAPYAIQYGNSGAVAVTEADNPPHKPPPGGAASLVDIFSFWKNFMGKSVNARFSEDKKRKVRDRLKEGYTAGQLKMAVVGARFSAFHMGQNEQRKKYDGLATLLKSGQAVEAHIERAEANGWILEDDKPVDRRKEMAETKERKREKELAMLRGDAEG